MNLIRTLSAPGVQGLGLWLVIALGGTGLLVQAERLVIRSRTVTQERIAEGWEAAGLRIRSHTLAAKENFWKVARLWGVDIDSVIGANPGLQDLRSRVGQTIRVPSRKGALHVVADGDSVAALADVYGISPETIMTANNIPAVHVLAPGLVLFLPGAKPAQLTPEMAAHYSLRGLFGSPLPGRITSSMGMRRHPVGGFRGKHTGIDLRAQEGTPVAAAAAGTVVETGEGEYIGRFVTLRHADSYTTIYGHCSKVMVNRGQPVKKGQVIARSGNTGRTTGPHLHFEIRKNGVPQDPLKYLW